MMRYKTSEDNFCFAEMEIFPEKREKFPSRVEVKQLIIERLKQTENYLWLQRYATKGDASHSQVKLERAQGGCLGTKSRRKT